MSSDLTIVTLTFQPSTDATSKLITDLAVGLQQKGLEIRVITSNRSYLYPNQVLETEGYYEGVRVSRLSIPKLDKNNTVKKLMMYWMFTNKAVNCLKSEQTKCVICLLPPLFAPYKISRFARKTGVKSILLVHDLIPDAWLNLGLSGKNPAFIVLRNQLIKALNFSDKIVLLGRDVKEYTLQTYGKELERKIVVIPNWAVVSSAEATAEEMKDVLQEKFTIVYSGNFGEASDFDTLIESAKLLESDHDLRFVLVGNGRRKPAVLSKVETLGLENVFFKDFLSDTTYRYLLNKGSVFVVAMNKGSKGTSVPSKFYTYLSAGKPVIGIVPEGSEVALSIEEKSLGFVCSDYQPATLASQIANLKNDEALYRQMSLNTRNVFASEYSREAIISSYYEIVKELIE